jgi:inorganic pyrophosphatase
MDFINYINFRDYLNRNESVAKEYEALKVSLAEKAPLDRGREKYLAGKHGFIRYTLRKALVNSYLGKVVRIEMDRPIGTPHPKHPDIIYPINYGYVPGVFGGDGEELDVYLLGVGEPVGEYTAKIIGIVHRRNDVEDKLVAAPEKMSFTAEEIERTISFQEQFYDSYVEVEG